MNCWECNKEGATNPAVGVCAQCNRGICEKHSDFDGSHLYCHAHNSTTRMLEAKKIMEQMKNEKRV